MYANSEPWNDNLCVLWLLISVYDSSSSWTNRTAKIVCRSRATYLVTDAAGLRYKDEVFGMKAYSSMLDGWIFYLWHAQDVHWICSWVADTSWFIS